MWVILSPSRQVLVYIDTSIISGSGSFSIFTDSLEVCVLKSFLLEGLVDFLSRVVVVLFDDFLFFNDGKRALCSQLCSGVCDVFNREESLGGGRGGGCGASSTMDVWYVLLELERTTGPPARVFSLSLLSSDLFIDFSREEIRVTDCDLFSFRSNLSVPCKRSSEALSNEGLLERDRLFLLSCDALNSENCFISLSNEFWMFSSKSFFFIKGVGGMKSGGSSSKPFINPSFSIFLIVSNLALSLEEFESVVSFFSSSENICWCTSISSLSNFLDLFRTFECWIRLLFENKFSPLWSLLFSIFFLFLYSTSEFDVVFTELILDWFVDSTREFDRAIFLEFIFILCLLRPLLLVWKLLTASVVI